MSFGEQERYVSPGKRYVKAYMSSPVAISITRISDLAIIDINDSYCAMLGYDRADVLGRSSLDIHIWQDPSDLDRLVAELREKGFVRNRMIRFKRKDGSLLMGMTSFDYLDLEGEKCVLSQVEDRTDEWRLDRKVEESAAHYRALFDAMSNAVVEEDFSKVKAYIDELRAKGALDLDAYFGERPDEIARCAAMIKILRFNREFLEYVNLSDAASVEDNPKPYIPDETMGVMRSELVALAAGQTSFDAAYPNHIPGSRIKHIRMRLAIVPGHEADWSSVLISFTDLTEEVKARDELAVLVQQKDVLMRELEHRVKNNLNIISSLLSLESAQVSGEPERKIFLDAQSRIKSISLIYELLSRSSQGETMSCKSYIESLAVLLHETYAAGRPDVSLVLGIEDIGIDVKRGVSLGLVVTELLTNSFKYAFPDRGGRVEVGVAARGDKIELSIADDGIGTADAIDVGSAASLGFQLIGMLVGQMGGTIKLSSANGFRADIEIPLKP
jgi:PAS domain S-box-containing protein